MFDILSGVCVGLFGWGARYSRAICDESQIARTRA